MDIVDPGYLKEIEDTEWIQEVLMEHFDGALEMMTANAIVYGGAIRDCLAGKELVGDLDIAASKLEFAEMIDSFQRGAKWVPAEGQSQKTTGWSPFKKQAHALEFEYAGAHRELSPIGNMVSFRTNGDRIVQLVQSKKHAKDQFQNALYLARTVDIICCGVIMTADGRVFEALPGAHEDCVANILRINEKSGTIYIDMLPSRVKKLTSRGWENKIDVPKTMRDVKAQQKRDLARTKRNIARKYERKAANIENKFGTEVQNYVIRASKRDSYDSRGPTGYSNELSGSSIARYFNGDPNHVLAELKGIATNLGIDLSVKVSPQGTIIYTAENAHLAGKVSSAIFEYKRAVSKQEDRVERAKRGIKGSKSPFKNPGPAMKYAYSTSTGRLKTKDLPKASPAGHSWGKVTRAKISLSPSYEGPTTTTATRARPISAGLDIVSTVVEATCDIIPADSGKSEVIFRLSEGPDGDTTAVKILVDHANAKETKRNFDSLPIVDRVGILSDLVQKHTR